MNNSNNYSRREFLNTCGKMSSIPVMSSVLSLQMTNQVLAQNTFTDYKALVCVFLRGGNDSFNMLMPGDTDGINQYREVRGAIASPINSGLEITGKQRDGSSRKFRVHPRMPEVRTMFNQGDLGFVANVGTLIRPTTVAEYRNGVNRPRGLFSHFEQEVSWQTSVPDSNPKHGWFGRMSEVLNSRLQNSDRVSMNISFIGNNRLQTGFNTSGFVASTRLGSYSGYTRLTHDAGMDQAYKTVIQNQVDYTRNSIIDQSEAYAEAVDGANLNTEFPRTALGSQLRDVAIAISRRGILGKSRQTFYVSENGYDTHSEVVSTQNERLPDVSEALYAFNEAMKELGVHDSVVTYTASDFGKPNCDGWTSEGASCRWCRIPN